MNNMKMMLLQNIYNITIPALELAIEDNDKVGINNIIYEQYKEIAKATGYYLSNSKDWYEMYGDNINGYVSHLIRDINNFFNR